MVLYAKARKEEAEKVRDRIIKSNAMNPDYPVLSDGPYVFFPLKQRIDGLNIVEKEAEKKERKPKNLRDALRGVIPDDKLDKVTRSFDSVGDIAIIEIPDELQEYEEEIGKAILYIHPHFKTVVKKAGKHEGIFRTMPVKVIAGEDKTETVYVESGVKMKVKVDKTYFSPRLSAERLRIANQVKEGETIAGFFAGVGPFPLVIAKRKQCKIYAIELNPVAYELMVENIRMNQLKGEIIPLFGDVREIAQSIPKCDRVLMPLPKGGEDFLDVALRTCKRGAIVHFYQFAPDNDLYSDAIEKIKKAAMKLGRKVSILNKKVVRHHAPHIEQIVIDFIVE